MKAATGVVLLQHWSRSPIALMPPIAAEEIKLFEQEYSVRLPDEIRDYYLAANGFAPPDDQDENGFSFWPLSRVCPVATFDGGCWSSAGTEDCFLFADYLSLSWGYAFYARLGSVRTRVCIVGTADRRPIWIADGFREFVDLYIDGDERLYSVNEPRL